MEYFILLIVTLIILFVTSQKIFSSLFYLLIKIVRSKNFTISMLSLFFFPGVVIHEVAHALMAGLLQVRVGDMEFSPVLSDGGLKMGSVQIGHTDPLRRFLIGVAPIIIGGGVLSIILYYFTQWITLDTLFNSFSNVLLLLVSLYGIFVITNTMFSSKKDMEGAIALGIFFTLVIVIIFIAGKGEWILWLVNQITLNSSIQEIVKRMLLLLLIPLSINLSVIGAFYLLFRRRI
jgi:hypothetical protein